MYIVFMRQGVSNCGSDGKLRIDGRRGLKRIKKEALEYYDRMKNFHDKYKRDGYVISRNIDGSSVQKSFSL